MPSNLDDLIETYSTHLAHQRGQSIVEARAFVRTLIELAQRDYDAAGAPLGANEAGFLAWLAAQPRLARTA